LKSQEKPKGSANYLSWKRRIEQTLTQAGVLEYTLGIEKGVKPITFLPNEKLGIGSKESIHIIWFTSNAHAYSMATRGSETVETIQLTVDAAEAWKSFKINMKEKATSLSLRLSRRGTYERKSTKAILLRLTPPLAPTLDGVCVCIFNVCAARAIWSPVL
jgi:hypothetical protein